ncbi:MAG TPA: serine/threonine protein kinase, partial [Thermoguttaceae bacterium]|nr:serine/threonine protein kinase [Thermoguttaceae bacterium]
MENQGLGMGQVPRPAETVGLAESGPAAKCLSGGFTYPPGSQPLPGYTIKRGIGHGGFGEVYYATSDAGKEVALKLIRRNLEIELRGLRQCLNLKHPNLLNIYDIRQDGQENYWVIMEYVAGPSLQERIAASANGLSESEILRWMQGIVAGVGYLHEHGIVHRDLKPANILLDQDGRPRLADFGQSRLSHEQAPALGTLFYMAPEQADLQATPDARWDVYALGALLYCMVTGSPPYRTPEILRQLEQAPNLVERLTLYRRWLRHSPRPTAHRQTPGVDRDLADIIDRCLAIDPQKRFPNVQAVLDALQARQLRRHRRPMLLVGALGPVLLLLVVSFFAWQGATAALQRSEEALIQRALESNKFAAQYAARTTAAEVARRYRAVQRILESQEFLTVFQETIQHPELEPILQRLADPDLPEAELQQLAHQLRHHPQRRKLQEAFERAIPPEMQVGKQVNSWFLDDPLGNQIARAPEEADVVTIGRNYAWRSYFHGGPTDMPDRRWRAGPGQHLQKTQMSAAYQSEATGRWNVAVSTPIRQNPNGRFLGVAGLTVGVGALVELHAKPHQFAVLVEEPTPEHPG